MIYDCLYDWQKKLVDRLEDKKAYGLFLDMGLGKTPISLALCEKHKVDKMLIVTINAKAMETADTSGSWFSWVARMSKPYKLSNKTEKSFSEPLQAYMVNFEHLGMRKADTRGNILRPEIIDFIHSCRGKRTAVIIDESHKMKDTSSLQTKCVMMIWKMIQNIADDSWIYLLTGTPFTHGYIDLYSQLKVLGLEMNKTAFKDTFCVMGNIRGLLDWQQPVVGYKNIPQLLDIVHKYSVTIKSDEVMELPEQIFDYHKYKVTESFKEYFLEKRKASDINKSLLSRNLKPMYKGNGKENNPFYRNIDYPSYNWTAETPSQFWLRARQLSIGFQGNEEMYQFYDDTRMKMIEKFLQDNPDNYIVFYSFTPEFITLFDMCKRLGYEIDIYNGKFKTLDNYNAYTKLSEGEKMLNESKRVILTNWQSGSTGMNFQEYNKCIIADLPVFRDWQQGLKRIHRTGQSKTCIYYVFIQENFLDKAMMKAIEEQQDYTEKTFESDFNRVKEIMTDE